MDDLSDAWGGGQAGKELANLLGRELVAAKKRVAALEQQVANNREGSDHSRVKQFNERFEADTAVVKELRREVTQYNNEKENLTRTIARLQEESTKLKDQKNEITKLNHRINALKSQRKKDHERAHDSKKARNELRQRKEKPAQVNQELKKVEENQRSKNTAQDSFNFMRSLPLCSERPVRGNLIPVGKSGIILKEYLASHPDTQKYASVSFSFPGRLIWCTSLRGHHHALAYGPTHTFDTLARAWKNESTFSSLYGASIELFYEEAGNVYYAGTYRCIKMYNPAVELPQLERNELLPYVIAGAAMSSGYADAPCQNVHKGTLSKLYREGVLKLECMGLQCVGFKADFYQTLVHLNQAGSHSRSKRKARAVGIGGAEYNKKRKRS